MAARGIRTPDGVCGHPLGPLHRRPPRWRRPPRGRLAVMGAAAAATATAAGAETAAAGVAAASPPPTPDYPRQLPALLLHPSLPTSILSVCCSGGSVVRTSRVVERRWGRQQLPSADEMGVGAGAGVGGAAGAGTAPIPTRATATAAPRPPPRAQRSAPDSGDGSVGNAGCGRLGEHPLEGETPLSRSAQDCEGRREAESGLQQVGNPHGDASPRTWHPPGRTLTRVRGGGGCARDTPPPLRNRPMPLGRACLHPGEGTLAHPSPARPPPPASLSHSHLPPFPPPTAPQSR